MEFKILANINRLKDIAAASIAQVHKAVLRKEGDIVSVKIRRPHIRSTIDTDMDILEYIANRLTFAMIIAAMIVGSSMIITTGVRPYIFGYPATGVIGYVISAVIGLWLLVNIIRTRNY